MILKNTQTTKVWLMALSLLLAVNYAKAQIHTQDKALCVRADFVFALDISGSVSSEETQEVVNAFMNQVNRYVVSEDGIRIGFVVFNGSVVYKQNLSGDVNTIEESIGLIHALERDGVTNIASSLKQARDMFEQSLLERPANIQRAVILLSDGDPGSGRTTSPQYDDDDIKIKPYYFNDKIFEDKEEDSKSIEVALARQIENLSLNQGYENRINIFTLNIASGSSDNTHLINIASDSNSRKYELHPMSYNLVDSYQPLIDWIDSLSICN